MISNAAAERNRQVSALLSRAIRERNTDLESKVNVSGCSSEFLQTEIDRLNGRLHGLDGRRGLVDILS